MKGDTDSATRARLANGVVSVRGTDGRFHRESGKTDWARLQSMSDEEVEQAAEEDPATVPVTEPVRVVRHRKHPAA